MKGATRIAYNVYTIRCFLMSIMYYLKITKIKYVKNGSKLEHLGIVHYDIFGQLNAKFMHSRCRISLNFINSFS
jgi:hypothetical protein